MKNNKKGLLIFIVAFSLGGLLVRPLINKRDTAVENYAEKLDTETTWKKFNMYGETMAPGILEGFEYPGTWTFHSFDSGVGSTMVFSDLGGETKETLLEKGYKLDGADQAISTEYNQLEDWDTRDNFVIKLDNVCGFTTANFRGVYQESQRVNTKTDIVEKMECEEILDYMDKQLEAFLNN